MFKSCCRSLAFGCCMVLLLAVPAQAGELVVSAAASLTDAFTVLEKEFETLHPGVDVVMNFASSGALYRQLEKGAPADVYASANPKWMNKAVEKGLVEQSAVHLFARNALVLTVPSDNPAGITSVQDLNADKVQRLAIGTPATVPAGQYAKQALTTLGMFDALQSKYIFCEHVRQALDYLVRGEVDGGFVYATDAKRAGDKVSVVQELELKTPVQYPIGVVKESHAAESAVFVEFVLSGKGQEILATYGFSTP